MKLLFNRGSLTKNERTVQIILRTIIVLFIIVGIARTTFVPRVKADEKVFYKYFTSIEVKPGDTLYGYYEEYGMGYDADEFIEEVCNINYIDKDDVIVSGTYLIVPYYSAELK